MQVFYKFFLFLFNVGQKGQMPCKLGKHQQIEKKYMQKHTKHTNVE